ncbi:penicillin-binding protein 2 [Terriglobus albidus]|uniref:penicillin-binding protein 2 n=1 Tax=Terriglobus albidus TaxID=1592106 RepID=UPI0021E0128B|nr:penicillin-binding protein 2 [Terriglobus albidus]
MIEEQKVTAREEKVSPLKLNSVQYAVALLLVVLIAGLWRLQVVSADNYRVLAEQNRVRKVPIMAPRGKIFDREGRLLVDNYASISCYLLREPARDWDADLPMIAQGLHMTVDQIQYVLRRYQFAPKYQPIPLKQDLSPDEVAFIEAHRNELPELETLDEQRRLYPNGGFAAHLIGYVGEISENDLNKEKYAFYQAGDVVGKSGVEATYDAVLRGTDGSRDVVVDSRGREVGQLGQQDPVPGKDLKLSIDLDLQMAAEKAMEGKTGAIVAMDPHTGEVLAMVSRPTYDPNQFAVRLTKEYWNKILNDPDHPMMNKTIQAQLAPGSTFKIIMSYAGLEEGVAQDMHVNCAGGGTFFGHFFACDKHHGGVDISHAIPWSCDTFYYTLAERLQIDTIAKYANSVGIGQKTGIDLPDEATGTMPSTAWKLKNFHDKWYAGEVISVGIGQGAVQASPIQLARALSGIASGGALKRPHVILDGQIPQQYQQAVLDTYPGSGDKQVSLKTENWQLITDAMAETLNSGTAAASHLEGVDFAGKTGTAQVMSHAALARSGGGHKTVPNAWFVGMTPRRNPDIVVAVLWENGDWGANAAKLGAQVVNSFVEKQRKKAGNLMKVAEAPKPATPLENAAKKEDSVTN